MAPCTVSLAVLVGLLLLCNCSTSQHFRVGYIEEPLYAFTYVDETNKTTVEGISIRLLEWMGKRASFTYDLLKLNYSSKFPGLPRQFKDKSIDWAVGNWALLHGRNYLATYLFPHVTGGHTVVIPYPTRNTEILAIVKPYRPSVWLCFLASGAIMTCLLVIFSRTKQSIYGYRYKDSFVSLPGASSYVIGVATNQGATCFSEARSTRLLAGVWCCAALVLVNAYSGSLITYITVPKVTPLISSLQDLANRSQPQILVRDASYLQVLLKTSPFYNAYRDNYLKYSEKPCDLNSNAGLQACLSLVQQGRHVLLVEKDLANVLVVKDFQQARTCKLTETADEFEIPNGASIMPLNSPYALRNRLDIMTLEALSYGLIAKWTEHFIPAKSHCLNYKHADSRKLRKLTLKEFSGAFILLGIGVFLGFLVLLLEHAYALFSRKKTARTAS